VTELQVHNYLVLTAFASAVPTFIALLWMTAPYGRHVRPGWEPTVPFALGLLCFLGGWAINQHADFMLIRLRQPGDSDYKIPHGGLYRWVSCPNYLGEMLEWAG